MSRIIILILMMAFSCGACFAQQAELIGFTGDISVKLQGVDEYVPAQEGMVLESGDRIKSTANASCELSFNQANTNLVRLSENTSAEVTFSGDEKMELTEGEIFASISELPGGSSFEIRTPTAVSGARGTDWVTKVIDEATEVEAVDDQPYVRHFESSGQLARKATFIQPGQMTTVRRFQPPEKMRPMARENREKWMSARKDIRGRGDQAFQRRSRQKPFDRQQFKKELREKRNPSVFKPLEEGKPGMDQGYKPFVSREKEDSLPRGDFFGQKQDRLDYSSGKNPDLGDSPETLRSFERDRPRQDREQYRSGQEGRPFDRPEPGQAEKSKEKREPDAREEPRKPGDGIQGPESKDRKFGPGENKPGQQKPGMNKQPRPQPGMPAPRPKQPFAPR